jgi:hypothetical protein
MLVSVDGHISTALNFDDEPSGTLLRVVWQKLPTSRSSLMPCGMFHLVEGDRKLSLRHRSVSIRLHGAAS